MEISAELERTFSDSQRGRARYYYRLSVYANPVWFLGLFLAANGQTALINTCVARDHQGERVNPPYRPSN